MRKFVLVLSIATALTGCATVGNNVERSLSSTSWGYKITKAPEPVYRGNVAQRFEVRPGDCSSTATWNDCKADRERSEVTYTTKFYPGTKTWISYLMFLPPSFETSPYVNTTLGQIHMAGGFTGTSGGYKSMPPLLQLNAKSIYFTSCYHSITVRANGIDDHCRYTGIGDIENFLGKWTRITMFLDAANKNPRVDLYVDGKLISSQQQTFPHDPDYYYFKYGIYRSFVTRHAGPMPTQIAYYDEIKVGSTREEVEDETITID